MVKIEEITVGSDLCMPLEEWENYIMSLIHTYGNETLLKVDAGYNNVSFVVEKQIKVKKKKKNKIKKKKNTKKKMYSIWSEDKGSWLPGYLTDSKKDAEEAMKQYCKDQGVEEWLDSGLIHLVECDV